MADHDTDHSRQCSRCGTAVSQQFVRVFGIGKTVHGCLNCRPRRELSQGDAAQRESNHHDSETLTTWRASDN
ncbi:DUF7563 family protein [Halonotius roseus]|uniref:Uncharacterized protein n=1 Tax=Halonotius roseus TaxID=2511997 RepID=A0A544QMT4_9EURY|nr:hypothetical protein [Halonotius roseus]TQQ80227.1 hypothetical protein EWF95_06945 [Halonotius roseus]